MSSRVLSRALLASSFPRVFPHFLSHPAASRSFSGAGNNNNNNNSSTPPPPSTPSSANSIRDALDKSLDDFFLKGSSAPLWQAADLDLTETTEVAQANEKDKETAFADVLDPKNPPKLNFSHYRLLSRVLLSAVARKPQAPVLNDDLNPTTAREVYSSVEETFMPIDYYSSLAEEKRALRDVLSSFDLIEAFDQLASVGVTLTDEQLASYDAAFKIRYPKWTKSLPKDIQERIYTEGDRIAMAEREKYADLIEQRLREAKLKGLSTKQIDEQLRAVVPEHQAHLIFSRVHKDLAAAPNAGESLFEDFNPYQITDQQLEHAVGKLRALILKRAAASNNYRYRPEVVELQRVLDNLTEEDAALHQPPPLSFKHNKIGNQRTCRFCQPDLSPTHANYIDYTNLELLKQFINARGMIRPRKQSGNCARHQNDIRESVKRARVIGLLSWSSDWTVPPEFVYGTESVNVADRQGRTGEHESPLPQREVRESAKMNFTGIDDAPDTLEQLPQEKADKIPQP